jgi:hypothetical protein
MFFVKEIRNIHTGGPDAVAEVSLGAAFGTYLKGLTPDEEANKDWSRYTPSGEVKMTITNPAAIEQFELGAVYSLTFDKVS